MKCAWIGFALFIANSAANEPYGGGGVNRNPYGRGINHNPPEGRGVNPNLPNGGGGGVYPNFKGDAAFRGCEKHPENTKSSSAIDSHYKSEVMPVDKNGAYVAIRSQQEMSSPIYINVMMPSFSYEVEVQGSSMMLSRCNMNPSDCHLEDESSLKGHNLINPHEWNYLHLMFSDNKMTMDVGDRLQVRSETTISEADFVEATWVIESGGDGDGVPFIVQFPCSEYREPPVTPFAPAAPDAPTAPVTPSAPAAPTAPVTPTHPQPNPLPPTASHNKNGTAESEKKTVGGGWLAALVIGILLAVILVALLTAVIILSIKKKRSMAVTEDTPLGETNQSYTQNQQKADTQTDTTADTKAGQQVAEP